MRVVRWQQLKNRQDVLLEVWQPVSLPADSPMDVRTAVLRDGKLPRSLTELTVVLPDGDRKLLDRVHILPPGDIRVIAVVLESGEKSQNSRSAAHASSLQSGLEYLQTN